MAVGLDGHKQGIALRLATGVKQDVHSKDRTQAKDK